MALHPDFPESPCAILESIYREFAGLKDSGGIILFLDKIKTIRVLENMAAVLEYPE